MLLSRRARLRAPREKEAPSPGRPLLRRLRPTAGACVVLRGRAPAFRWVCPPLSEPFSGCRAGQGRSSVLLRGAEFARHTHSPVASDVALLLRWVGCRSTLRLEVPARIVPCSAGRPAQGRTQRGLSPRSELPRAAVCPFAGPAWPCADKCGADTPLLPLHGAFGMHDPRFPTYVLEGLGQISKKEIQPEQGGAVAAHSLGGGNLCRRPPCTRVSAASRSRRSSFFMKGPLPWFVSSSAKALCPVMCYGWLLWCRGTAGRHVAYGDAPGTHWVLRPSCGSRRCALWGMPGGLPLPKGVAGCDQGPRAELRPGPQALQPRHPHCGLTPNAVLTSRQGRGWMVWGPEWRAEDPGDARGKSSNPAETPGLALAPSSPSPGEGVRRGRRQGDTSSPHTAKPRLEGQFPNPAQGAGHTGGPCPTLTRGFCHMQGFRKRDCHTTLFPSFSLVSKFY